MRCLLYQYTRTHNTIIAPGVCSEVLEPHQQLEQGSRGKRYTYTLTAYCLSSLQDNEIIRDDQPP